MGVAICSLLCPSHGRSLCSPGKPDSGSVGAWLGLGMVGRVRGEILMVEGEMGLMSFSGIGFGWGCMMKCWCDLLSRRHFLRLFC